MADADDRRTEPMNTEWYQALLAPQRVAVIGASADPAKGGLLRNLLRLGFDGQVIPVNPKGGVIEGIPAVTDIRDVTARVDLALIAVPAPAVPDAVRGCAEAGVKVAYVVSSGFAELGEVGAALQEQAAQEARKGSVRLLGPNTNGLISARAGLAGSIMTLVEDLTAPLERGQVAVITQSGAIGAFILTGCQTAAVPVGTYLSTGNEADVGFEELLSELVDDPAVEVILAYVEGLRDGPRFIAAARRARTIGKPIVLLKVGVSEEGARVSASHTASMAGSDLVYDGVLRQLGVRRARSLRELIDAGRLLASSPRGLGRRVGVVSISGGLAVMATDEIVKRGLDLGDWGVSAVAQFKAALPDYVSIHNPLDTSGLMADDAHLLTSVLSAADADDNTDVTVLCLGGSRARERSVGNTLRGLSPSLTKPLLVVWVGGSSEVTAQLREAGLFAFDSVEDALAALDVACHRPNTADDNQPVSCGQPALQAAHSVARELVEQARTNGQNALDEVASKTIMRAFGLPCAAEKVLQRDGDVAALSELGYPVVAKIQSPLLLHKSDVGGVRLGLADQAATNAAIVELRALAEHLGLTDADVVVQEMVNIGVELILGATVDATFGPVVSIGIGGVTAEVEPDVEIRLPSLTRSDVYDALSRLRAQRLLDGYRGSAAVPRQELAGVVVRFAEMVTTLSASVREIDINPLVVGREEGRLVAVDGLMVLASNGDASSHVLP